MQGTPQQPQKRKITLFIKLLTAAISGLLAVIVALISIVQFTLGIQNLPSLVFKPMPTPTASSTIVSSPTVTVTPTVLGSPTATMTSVVPTPTATPTPTPTPKLVSQTPSYPQLKPRYEGSVHNITQGTAASLILKFEKQNQGEIAGSCEIWSPSDSDNGPLTGTIDTLGNLKGTVKANSGIVFQFEGTIQQDESLKGKYNSSTTQGEWSANVAVQ